MKKITYALFAASISFIGLVSCEVDEFQDGLSIGDVGQIYASNGDINREAYLRANADGSLAAALAGGSLTAFLPYDQAYKNAGFINIESVSEGDAAALKEILLYHVFQGAKKSSELTQGSVETLAPGKSMEVDPGDEIFVSGIGNQGVEWKVVATDSKASNGYIHSINGLLLPGPRKVTDIAAQNGYFDILEAALIRADLANTLSGTGPFTVFAPGDDAFISYLGIATQDGGGNARPHAVIQQEAIAAINVADPAELADLLKYHVVNGNLGSEDFTAGALTTLNGKTVVITLDKGLLKSVTGIGNASASNPLQADVLGINGIVHIVDRVLKPE